MTDPASFESTTPRLGLPYLFSGQAQKEFYINESLAKIDLLLQPTIEEERTAPPANPEEGQVFLAATGATGDWAGHQGDIAGWNGGQWLFIAPHQGLRFFNKDTERFIIYNGGWKSPSAPSNPQGGTVIDQNLRTAFADLLIALNNSGVLTNS